MLPYINYGLLLWGIEVKNLEVTQKRAIRLITGSNYIAHTEPLFIQLGLLKVQDIFKDKDKDKDKDTLFQVNITHS